jgi:hypothetical protein
LCVGKSNDGSQCANNHDEVAGNRYYHINTMYQNHQPVIRKAETSVGHKKLTCEKESE